LDDIEAPDGCRYHLEVNRVPDALVFLEVLRAYFDLDVRRASE
jgi:hypothetical protein